MRNKYKFIWGFVLLLLAINISADTDSNTNNICRVTTLLKPNQWKLIGIPCNAPKNNNTVEDIFADDISGRYGTDWILLGYNPSNNSYENISLHDIPKIGTGYWIISFSNLTLLDMPDGSEPVSQISSTQCASASCFEKTLTSNGTQLPQIIANPFQHSFSWSTIQGKVDISNNACSHKDGCTLAKMQEKELVYNQGWHYNGSEYIPLKGSKVSPWMGFWLSTMNTASNAHPPTLLFPGIEPKPEDKPNLDQQNKGFFNLGFEASPLGEYDIDDIKHDWLGIQWAKTDGRVKVEVEDSNKFIRVKYPKGGVGPSKGGGLWKVNFMDAFGKTYNELYVSYKLRFAKGFDPVRGGKLHGMFGGDGNTGGRPADGYNGWSTRMVWREKMAAVFYAYHADMQNNFGDNYYWKNKVEPQRFLADEWVQVEHRIVMNSPGDKNGILQGWYNGELVLDKRDMRYRMIDDFAIDGFYFSTFFGGSESEWAPTRDESIDFDDFIFSTEPITH